MAATAPQLPAPARQASRRSARAAARAVGLGLALLVGAAPALAASPDDPPVVAGPRPVQTAVSFDLESRVLGEVRQVNVWTPPGYEPGSPVAAHVYLLDGGLDQDFHHIAGLGSLASLSWTFGPVLIVGVASADRRAEFTPAAADDRYRAAFPTSGGASRFRRFLAEEVIPFVEGRYATAPRRALIGESLAGLFVVDTLLTEPELFHDYVAVSPSLWWDDRNPMRTAGERLSPSVADRRVYLAMADEGGTMQEGVDLLAAALRRAPEDRIRLRYADRSAVASHATVYHSAAEEALRWLYPQPPYQTGPSPWYMVDGAAPPSGEATPD